MNFTIEPILPCDLGELELCIQDTFPRGEPMARALALAPEDYLDYTRLVARKAVRDKLSVGAWSDSRRLLGFCVNEDMATSPRYSAAAVSPRMMPLLVLLEELDDEYLQARTLRVGQVFHLYMLGVREEARGQGVARALVAESVSLARTLRFRRAVAETTGNTSRKICEDQGFRSQYAIAYRNFCFKSKPVFSQLEGPEHCHLVEHPLLSEGNHEA